MQKKIVITFSYLFLLFALISACTKQSSSPIINGRNIDSLRTRPYPDRLLAFSIELGNRSKDFDERFDVIYNKIQFQSAWQEIVLFEINRQDFITVERHNLAYLDSLFGILQPPPDDLKPLYETQQESLNAFKDNYRILRQIETEKAIESVIDKKYRNDIIIKSALFRVANFFDSDIQKEK